MQWGAARHFMSWRIATSTMMPATVSAGRGVHSPTGRMALRGSSRLRSRRGLRLLCARKSGLEGRTCIACDKQARGLREMELGSPARAPWPLVLPACRHFACPARRGSSLISRKARHGSGPDEARHGTDLDLPLCPYAGVGCATQKTACVGIKSRGGHAQLRCKTTRASCAGARASDPRWGDEAPARATKCVTKRRREDSSQNCPQGEGLQAPLSHCLCARCSLVCKQPLTPASSLPRPGARPLEPGAREPFIRASEHTRQSAHHLSTRLGPVCCDASLPPSLRRPRKIPTSRAAC